MKKLFFSLAIAFALLFNSVQLNAAGPLISHNMTSTFESIYINKPGATIYVFINNSFPTLVDYTGVIIGQEIIWGSDWFDVDARSPYLKVEVDEVVDNFGAPRQIRLYLKDAQGKDYQFLINQNPY